VSFKADINEPGRIIQGSALTDWPKKCMNGGGWRFFGQQGAQHFARKFLSIELIDATENGFLAFRSGDMPIYDEYRIVINKAQRRVIMRALTNAMANDRLLSKDGALSHPTQDEYMQLIRLFSTIEPSVRKAAR
jgi:hypothetical protein